MQLDLIALCNWSIRNRIPLNIGKCAVLSYYRGRGVFDTEDTMDNEKLKRVAVMKDLGVIFSSKLWHYGIIQIWHYRTIFINFVNISYLM